MVPLVLRLVLVLLAAYVVWHLFRPSYALTIVIDGHQIKRCRGMPDSKVSDFERFLEKELAFNGRLTILGSRTQAGILHYKFRGQIDSGTRQQIRNFLHSI